MRAIAVGMGRSCFRSTDKFRAFRLVRGVPSAVVRQTTSTGYSGPKSNSAENWLEPRLAVILWRRQSAFGAGHGPRVEMTIQ